MWRTPLRRRGSLGRTLIPLILFVFLVAGIAWVAQFLPNWRTPPAPAAAPPAKAVAEQLLRFTALTTAREGKDGYLPEFEYSSEGHLEYVFQNVVDEPVELGIHWKQCSCSGVQVCLLQPEEAQPLLEQERQQRLAEAVAALERLTAALPRERWQRISSDETRGLLIPAGQTGVLQLLWRPRAAADDMYTVAVKLWAKRAHVPYEERLVLEMHPKVALVPPVRLHPLKYSLGRILPKSQVTREFLYWSATRQKLEVTVAGPPDPCLLWEVLPVPAEEFASEEKKLAQASFKTRIRAACRLRVTLYEERQGKQLDIGALIRSLPVQVRADGEFIELSPPLLVGKVCSDVDIVGSDEFGQINLGSFSLQEGTSQVVRLLCRPELQLHLDPQANSPLLQLRLSEKKVTDENEAVWELEVRVPPGAGLSPETAIVLQSQAPGRMPRRIRIHVTGIVTRP